MRRLVFIGLLSWLQGCISENGARITVRNESEVPVHQLHVAGRCFDKDLGTLVPGGVATVRVKPCGESGIRTTFVANSAAHETPEVGYVEASDMYSEKVVIGPDFKASLDP